MASAIFPLQALQPVRHFAPVGKLNLALSIFPSKNSAPTRVPKMVHNVDSLTEHKPPDSEVLGAWEAIWPRPSA